MNLDNKSILNESDPYKILGLDYQASISDISKKYKELAKEYHPDRHSDKSEGLRKEINQVFTKITSAFNILKDPGSREKIDYERRMKEKRSQAQNLGNPETVKTYAPENPKPDLRQTQPGNIDISSLIKDSSQNSKEIKQKKAEVFYERGLAKYKKGDYEGAISDYQSAIDLQSEIARYHSSLGLAMKAKGWNGYAMAEFKIALNFDPNDQVARENYVKSTPKNDNNSANQKQESGILGRVKNLFKKN